MMNTLPPSFTQFYLAFSSPHRSGLLQPLCYQFDTIASQTNEEVLANEMLFDFVKPFAEEKHHEAVVI